MTFKQKAEHFFYYYKWHVILTVIAVLVAGLIFKSCTSVKEPDVNIAYISEASVSTETYDKLFEELKKNNLILDVNGDGETGFYFDPTIVKFTNATSEDYQIYEKLQVVLSAGSQSLILAHQYALEDFEWAFDDIGKYAKDSDKTVSNSKGAVIGISVEGNEFLESIGISTENLYVSMHLRTESQIKKGKFEKEFAHAHEILKFILEKQ